MIRILAKNSKEKVQLSRPSDPGQLCVAKKAARLRKSPTELPNDRASRRGNQFTSQSNPSAIPPVQFPMARIQRSNQFPRVGIHSLQPRIHLPPLNTSERWSTQQPTPGIIETQPSIQLPPLRVQTQRSEDIIRCSNVIQPLNVVEIPNITISVDDDDLR